MKLVPLQCPVCNQSLPAGNDDLVVACGNCRNAILLDEQGLRPLPVTFAQPRPGTTPTAWVPVWLFQGQVTLHRRETQGGNAEKEARSFWSQPRYFYIPAWDITLQGLQQISLPMLRAQPRFSPLPAGAIPSTPFQPVTVSAEDAQKLTEFLVLELEVDRQDWLKSISFDISLGQPALWILPQSQGNLVVDETGQTG
jgi:hypothetical protein